MAPRPPTKPRPPQQRAVLQERLLRSLDITLPIEPTTTAYRVALAAVCGAMLLVPLLYVSLIGLLAYTARWCWLHAPHGSAFYSYLCCVFAVLAILFLIKPIFIREQPLVPPSKLKREAEPFLFQYVEAVCRAVNAPIPDSIRIDCNPNAAASLSHGLVSVFTGKVSLTIGLPLVAGLSIREFTGVLAHEFGHFSQGYGMRATALIRTANYWFFKAAYSRDRWDNYLATASRALPIRLGIFVYTARGLIWLARRFIAFVALVSHGISSALLRQMEFDADRYEIGLVGSKAFNSTAAKLSPMSAAHQMALNDLAAFYSEDRLPDEFPKLVATNVPYLDKDVLKAIREADETATTGWFDTHPATKDRVAASNAINSDGAIELHQELEAMPATVIFQTFSRVSKGATNRLYRRVLGEEFDQSKLHPADELIARRDAERLAGEALDRYFRVHIPILRPLRLSKDSLKPPEKPREAVAELKQYRSAVSDYVDRYRELADGLAAAETAWLKAAAASTLVLSRVRFNFKDLSVRSRRKADVAARMRQADTSVQNLGLAMMDYEEAAEHRLTLALRLLRLPKVQERIADGNELAATTAQLIPDTRTVTEMMQQVRHLRLANVKLMALFAHLERDKEQPELYEQIQIQVRELYGVLRTVRKRLGDATYPFDHANDTMTIAAYVLPYMPDEHDLGGLIDASQHAIERLAEIQLRLFAKLAFAAEQVELALEIAPIRSRRTSPQSKAVARPAT